jgi:hypothetical protein
MHKWIVGSTCAAAVLSLAVASAQNYPTGTERRATPSDRSANAAQRVTMTGCGQTFDGSKRNRRPELNVEPELQPEHLDVERRLG